MKSLVWSLKPNYPLTLKKNTMPFSKTSMLFVLCVLFHGFSVAQNLYQGTFVTTDGQFGMQLKSVSDGFHGILVSNQGTFALKGKKTSTGLSGTVYSEAGSFSFSGSPADGGWNITSEGIAYHFYQVTTEHELDGMDLTPYFSEENTATQNTSNTSTRATKKTTVSTNYSGVKKQVFDYVASSQLVYYQRTSYVNSSSASSLTYVNFCADGRFTLNFDGGFSVEGNYGGNAQGASRGSNSGTWQIETATGKNPAIVLNYGDSQTGRFYVTTNNLKSGRWRVANTQYALVKNKVSCK
ncbi:MAG: hypothetical protein AAGL34_00705 [Bacteroidota bacterium]